jgi:hypothetical protein
VEYAAEEVAPPDLQLMEGGVRWRIGSVAAIRRSQVECSVWTPLVEVADVDAEDVLELAAAENQESVEALPAYAADPTFSIGIRVRGLDWRSDDLDAFAAEDAVERTADFVSRSWIRKRGREPRSSRSISRLRACWSIHAVSGLLVQATYSILRLPIERKAST